MQGSIAHKQGRSNRADQTGQVKQGRSPMAENWREGGTAVLVMHQQHIQLLDNPSAAASQPFKTGFEELVN